MRVAAGLGATLLSSVVQGQYVPYTTYDASNFFTDFEFFSGPDPTHGFVEYVDADTAFAEGLASTDGDAFIMAVDSVTVAPANGRKSVRLTSTEAYTHGLFIIDVAHMPAAVPGSWPAFWMFGPNWPGSGEIDIIEGVNTQETNSVTLHTNPGCIITNEGTDEGTQLAGPDCNAGNGNTGCGQHSSNNQNYGDGLNAIGGAVYATEWTSDYIAVWHFPPTGVPADIGAGAPDPSQWGAPIAKFNGGAGCNLDSYFMNNNLGKLFPRPNLGYN